VWIWDKTLVDEKQIRYVRHLLVRLYAAVAICFVLPETKWNSDWMCARLQKLLHIKT
jgi:hypothetical protein